MNKKRIEQMIPIAMNAISESGILNEELKLPSNYSGYVDSYGPTIIQSGLLSAVAFYDDPEKPRNEINMILLKILKKIDPSYISNDTLFDLVSEDVSASERRKRQTLILEAIVSCKLAMKTFPKIKKKEG